MKVFFWAAAKFAGTFDGSQMITLFMLLLLMMFVMLPAVCYILPLVSSASVIDDSSLKRRLFSFTKLLLRLALR
jgi:hypothetical protein